MVVPRVSIQNGLTAFGVPFWANILRNYCWVINWIDLPDKLHKFQEDIPCIFYLICHQLSGDMHIYFLFELNRCRYLMQCLKLGPLSFNPNPNPLPIHSLRKTDSGGWHAVDRKKTKCKEAYLYKYFYQHIHSYTNTWWLCSWRAMVYHIPRWFREQEKQAHLLEVLFGGSSIWNFGWLSLGLGLTKKNNK